MIANAVVEFTKESRRQALHFACTSLDAALRDDAALYTESTFAVHRAGTQKSFRTPAGIP